MAPSTSLPSSDALPPYTDLWAYRKRFAEAAPILMYHKVGSPPTGTRFRGLYLPTWLLARQLCEWKSTGWTSVGLEEFLQPAEPIRRRVCLTFDDGYADVHREALPLLREQGFRAILFLVADRIGGSNDWDAAIGEKPVALMDRRQIEEWLQEGQEIGGHTLTHPSLVRLSLPEARREILDGKKKLEDLFGRPVEHFSYPYGDWNPQIRDLVAEAGYRTACTVERGINGVGADPFLLRRIMVRRAPRTLKTLFGLVPG
ncbi:Peptidoglycan-N-acetylglucosamine deacetylase [Methylacidimicrobium cyclopophantes]|uniref:Peptidoglycan-N-acetylglucosamine deacetylase n=1 Tax=Methylacidimicrobium cyclopophantes TaxID=1041766 RepID=A0A5E6MFR2_9BACT|nr:polysaccharide deacetylase family protein [Methylacidimicrobium cyclopophantes]VVM07083.1 Peptidoglycan-N-acetylglucosamine deacetylase [Methylacidimicrobium cyclopophantes]